ncbi:F-box protein SKIP31 [Selaginella moellendorffii]|uniref:F-box protein SKIP31 n=1 Tax=Selaginella moellendorffii TaxID=88036 RepID=UPI000D1C3B4F|nr:F-box protein SKIP31 [Selaginella moellendorffii]|eukprot:XP_024525483.1 F-box protein SKIP31 [Selaginella moellendorffii]
MAMEVSSKGGAGGGVALGRISPILRPALVDRELRVLGQRGVLSFPSAMAEFSREEDEGEEGKMGDASLEEDGGGEEEEDDAIAQFLEAEVMEEEDEDLAVEQEEEEESIQPLAKKRRIEDLDCIESGEFRKIPPDLFRNILKFLSPEDLSSCAKVCHYLRRVASDETLWKKLYFLRWGPPPFCKLSSIEWKQLYFEKDKADVIASLRNTEFREYYLQMEIAKRSQAPVPSQIKDELGVFDPSIADQVTQWRRSHKLSEVYSGSHTCSGRTCSYHQIGDVYICEKTGCAHFCGDACREIVMSPNYNVCKISGRCFDPCVFPVEEDGEEDEANEGPQLVAAEEPEPFLGTGRLARAYSLGYNCRDDREFERALRCC